MMNTPARKVCRPTHLFVLTVNDKRPGRSQEAQESHQQRDGLEPARHDKPVGERVQ